MEKEAKLKLIDEIYESTTPIQFVEFARKLLLSKGFVELKETEVWKDIPSKYFVTRNDKCLIVVNSKDKSKGLVIASDICFPCLQAKPNSFDIKNGYNRVRCAYTSAYNYYNPSNSLLCTSGQVLYHENDDDKNIHRKLFKTNYPVGRMMTTTGSMYLPFTPEENNNVTLTLQTSDDISDSLPNQTKALLDIIEHETGVKPSQIVDFDAFFYDYHKPQLIGTEQQWIIGYMSALLAVALSNLHFIADAQPENGTLISHFFTNTSNMYSQISNFLGETMSRSGFGPEFLPKCLRIYTDTALSANILKNPTHMGQGPIIISSQNRSHFSERSIEAKLIDKLQEKGIQPIVENVKNFMDLGIMGPDQANTSMPTIRIAIGGISGDPYKNSIFDPSDLKGLETYFSIASEL